MTRPAPGWHPDPTARHDYRYWDGSEWTDDVADGGLMAWDPLADPEPEAGPGPVTPPAGERWEDVPAGYGYGYGPNGDTYRDWDDPTNAYAPNGGSYRDWDDPTRAYGPTAGDPDGDWLEVGWSDGDDPSSADIEPPRRKRRGARLLVGLGLLAVALAAGAVLVVNDRDGDRSADGTQISDDAAGAGDSTETDGDDPGTSSSSDTTATTAGPGEPGAPGDPDVPGDPDAPGDAGGDPGGPAGEPEGSNGSGGLGGDTTATTGGGQGPGGGLDELDTSSEEAMIDSMATVLQESSGGSLSPEQARCVAQGMVDTVGVEGLMAMTGANPGGSDPTAGLSPEDMQGLQGVMGECQVAQSPGG